MKRLAFLLLISIPITGYSQQTDSIIDIRDSQEYKVVKMGQQWWMQENLNIGTMIDSTQDETDNEIIEKYCYRNSDSLCNIYGGLYQWHEMMDYNLSDNGNPGITEGICPVGWHLPTDKEWKEFEMYIGMSQAEADGEFYFRGTDEGDKMKETGTIHWLSPNTGATNESGFTALPGGSRNLSNGYFSGMGNYTIFWSSTDGYVIQGAWCRELRRDYSGVHRGTYVKGGGFSVRCLRDSSKFGYLTISNENFRTVSDLNFYGDNTTAEIIITNSSAGKTINILSINTKNSAYSLNKSSVILSPGDSIHLIITFNPPVKDIYPDTLFVNSDDPYNSLNTIPLNGTFPPEILFADSINISCYGYSNGSATITPSLGTPPYQYQWDDPGNTTGLKVTGLEANTYYHVTVTDSLGWTAVDSIMLSEPSPLTSYISGRTEISCFGYSDGVASVTPSGGTPPYSYSWAHDAAKTDSTASGLIANYPYQVQITDAKSCSINDDFTLTQPDILQSGVTDSTNISCHGFTDGAALLAVTGGTRPYEYLWDDLVATTDSAVFGLSPDQYYHAAIQDANGCSTMDSVILSQPDVINVEIKDSSNISCFGGNDGSAFAKGAGGTKPYHYSWDDPGNSTDTIATGLSANIYYHVSVTDGHSCPPVIDSVILSEPSKLVITISDSTNISCFGLSDGTATATPSGGVPPYTVQWDDNGSVTEQTVTGLSANINYHVDVMDDHLCDASTSLILSQPDSLKINPYYSEIICLNSDNGFIGTNVSGGTSPYSYLWSTGDETVMITDLEAGEYSVQVTDGQGCIDSVHLTISNVEPFDNEHICIVTIDITSGRNLVIWEKTPGKGIAYYNIYRENNLIGTIPVEDLSVFVDNQADPEVRPYLYKISVIDTCGNESPQSPFHKPLFLQYVSSVDGVNLTWSKYEIQGELLNFDNYALYRGSDSVGLSVFDETIPTEINFYTDNDPKALTRKYYYRIAGILTSPCYPTGGKKADSSPYSHSFSNIEDNRLQDTASYIPELSEESFTIYPNPFTESTTIKFNNPEGHSYALFITDISGKVCRIVNNISSSEYELNKGNLKEGIYFAEMRGPRIYRGKIVIE